MDADDLIRSHLPLVESIARRYVGRGEPLEDLRQCGAVGLVLAARRWDPNRGVTFGAYATPLVAGEIRRHLRDHGRLVRLPRRIWETAGRCRGAMRELSAALGRTATALEVAAFTGLSVGEVIEALAASEWPTPFEDLPDTSQAQDPPAQVRDPLSQLAPGQRRLLELVALEGRSQRQVAELYGVSQAQVSRAVTSTMRDVRELLQSQDCPESARVLAG